MPVELDITEMARHLVRSAERDARRQLQQTPKRRIAKPLLGLGVVDPVQIRVHAALLRMVSISEAYADVFYEMHLERESASATRVTSLAVEEHLVQVTRTWQFRDDALKRVLGIRSGTERKGLEPFIDTRNAIAHGLGRLTRQQRRRPAVPNAMAAVGVLLSGEHVILTDIALERCADAVVTYVGWLDSESRIP